MELALEYAYDRSGRMTGERRTENGATVESSYVYDALGQLTGFTRSDGPSESYAYDPVGNMTAKTQNDVRTAMTYNAANQLIQSVTGADKTTYTYDANGNLVRSENAAGARSYAYNALNLLSHFTREDGYTETYAYNANRLLSEIRTGEGLTTALSWDILNGDGVVLSAAQNGETTDFTYGLERVSAMTGKTRTEYVYDGRGSVAAEVSYNTAWYTFGGALARKNVTPKSYTPFGEAIGEAASGFGYNGEYYSAATEMIYLRARFYAPEMNRFSQKDVLRGAASEPQSLNRYLYVQNDPVNFCDPSGERTVNTMMADGGGVRRISSAPTVTKPGVSTRAVTAIPRNNTVSIPMTDTGTGGSRSAYSASRVVADTGNGRVNQGTQARTSQTSGVTQESPCVQNVTGNSGYSCGGEINAPGAGDCGRSSLGATWNKIVDWVSSDKGQKTLMIAASTVGIIAGVALVATGAGSGIGARLIAMGASSLIGGFFNEWRGGSFLGGWVGGAASGLISSFGFSAAGAFYNAAAISNTTGAVLQYGISSFVFGGLGAGTGAFVSNVAVQQIDTGEVNWEQAEKNGMITGSVMSLLAPFTPIPVALHDVSPAIEATFTTAFEFFSDSFSNLVSREADRYLVEGDE